MTKKAETNPFPSLAQLSEDDLFGRFYLRTRKRAPYKGYYAALKAIRPLLRSAEWRECVTGFFINVAGEGNGVRLSYFTSQPDETLALVQAYAKRRMLTNVQPPDQPHVTRISEAYGGEELRFRCYLTVSTLIGLDITEARLTHARRLLATFRWQVLRNRHAYVSHFEPTFDRDSPFFRSLTPDEKEQFWSDLMHWPNPPQVDWAHLFVNMVLGRDWFKVWLSRLPPQPILSNRWVSRLVKKHGFRVPRRWRP